jgi:hypothetical protein
MKYCSKCQTEKPLVEFAKNKTMADGRQSWCKECFAEKRWAERYGILGFTRKDYEALREKQGGCCAICKRHESDMGKRFDVDHCHDTGKIRGLLCASCNWGLGKFGDDEELLQAAINYLREG